MPQVKTPTTPAEFAEVLADDARRAEIFATEESTAEFMTGYNRAMNASGEIGRQLEETVVNTMTEFMRDSGIAGDAPDYTAIAEAVAGGPRSSAQRAAAYNPRAPGAAADKIGFANMGEFARTIWTGHEPRDDAGRAKLAQLKELSNAYSSVDPATGGFLIPESFRADILSLALEKSVVRSRATVIQMTNPTQLIPFVDVTTNAGSLYGGMIWYWTPEQGEILTSEGKFGRVKLEANKLTGGAAIPNELFSDASALTSWLQRAIPEGLAYNEDDAFLTGSGVDQPLGVRESTGKISVTRDTTGEVNFADVVNMFARMLPQSMGSAVWVANQTLLPSLMALSIDVGTGGSAVSIVNIADKPVLTMLGRPIVFTEKVPALGSAGDLEFIDFAYYLIGDRQAVSMESSQHARFMNDETLFKIIERVDGRPWVQSAITPKNGDTLSPYVELAA